MAGTALGCQSQGWSPKAAKAAGAAFHRTRLPAATGGPPPGPFSFAPLELPCFLQLSGPQSPQPNPAASALPPAQPTQSFPQLCLVWSSSPPSPLQPSLALFSPL